MLQPSHSDRPTASSARRAPAGDSRHATALAAATKSYLTPCLQKRLNELINCIVRCSWDAQERGFKTRKWQIQPCIASSGHHSQLASRRNAYIFTTDPCQVIKPKIATERLARIMSGCTGSTSVQSKPRGLPWGFAQQVHELTVENSSDAQRLR